MPRAWRGRSCQAPRVEADGALCSRERSPRRTCTHAGRGMGRGRWSPRGRARPPSPRCDRPSSWTTPARSLGGARPAAPSIAVGREPFGLSPPFRGSPRPRATSPRGAVDGVRRRRGGKAVREGGRGPGESVAPLRSLRRRQCSRPGHSSLALHVVYRARGPNPDRPPGRHRHTPVVADVQKQVRRQLRSLSRTLPAGPMVTPTPAAATRAHGRGRLSASGLWLQSSGEGGMGEVYAAEPVDGGRACAVKILRPEFLGEPRVLTRFLEEGRHVPSASSTPTSCACSSAPAEDGSPYLVMELLEGVPSAHMKNGGRVPPRTRPILQGILAGSPPRTRRAWCTVTSSPTTSSSRARPSGHFVGEGPRLRDSEGHDVAGGMGTRTRTGMLLGRPRT